MKRFQIFLALLALALAVIITQSNWIAAAFLFSLFALTVNAPKARLCVLTLSVPEILMDVLEAFKLTTPQLFGPNGFATDFSSQTAVLGDKITAHIDHVPVTSSYNPAPGPFSGFYNGAQDVATIVEDVPVTLNQLVHVPVKIAWLTQLSSRLPLYQRAIKNIGYALGKKVVDSALSQVATNFSNSILLPTAIVNLDSMEAIRSTLNLQKAAGGGRYGFVSSALAQAIANDDRTRSKLFYAQLNEEAGFHRWENLAGNAWVTEYPDITSDSGGYIGFFGDRRAITVAVRRPNFSNAAEQLGIPQVMGFYPIQDDQSKLFMTGVGWQEPGTGDVYVSAAILFGTSAGNQGGAPGSITDNAGLLVRQN